MSENRGLSIQFKNYDTPFLVKINNKVLGFYLDKRSTKYNLRFNIKCDKDIEITTPKVLYHQRENIKKALQIISTITECSGKESIDQKYLLEQLENIKTVLSGKNI